MIEVLVQVDQVNLKGVFFLTSESQFVSLPAMTTC